MPHNYAHSKKVTMSTTACSHGGRPLWNAVLLFIRDMYMRINSKTAFHSPGSVAITGRQQNYAAVSLNSLHFIPYYTWYSNFNPLVAHSTVCKYVYLHLVICKREHLCFQCGATERQLWTTPAEQHLAFCGLASQLWITAGCSDLTDLATSLTLPVPWSSSH
jgi:hypothetical protein